MGMKLRPVINFTNILQAAFWPIFFCQIKLQTKTVSREKHLKTLVKNAVRKLGVILRPGENANEVIEGDALGLISIYERPFEKARSFCNQSQKLDTSEMF